MTEVPPPDSARLMAAVDATWPPEEMVARDGWVLRRSTGGGQRVTAASGAGEVGAAETAMRAWGQHPLFRLIPADTALDAELNAAGYRVVDPVALYAAPAEALAGDDSLQAQLYTATMRLAIMEEIWREGGIGPDRLAIMDRVAGPHAHLLSRAADSPVGAAFVGIDGDVAMIHAIEVLTRWRRQGAGALLLKGAARFALAHGARWLTLAVTEANGPANALYARLGMTVAGRYHYRKAP